MSLIKIDYQTMRDTASIFKAQSEAVNQIITTLNSKANDLSVIWEGTAENAFVEELNSCNQLLLRVPNMLDEISTALNNTAARIEEAEREAAANMASTIVSDGGGGGGGIPGVR